MRTTVTLDPDVEAVIRRLMHERGQSFKQVLNDAVRTGTLGQGTPRRAYTTPRHMGTPHTDLNKALRLAAQLEDDDIARKLERGK